MITTRGELTNNLMVALALKALLGFYNKRSLVTGVGFTCLNSIAYVKQGHADECFGTKLIVWKNHFVDIWRKERLFQ